MASYPSYNPNIWVGGISTKDYKQITSKKNNYPNQSRAFQGEFAPGSTFKAISTPAAVKAGYSLNGSYPCPSGYPIGGSLKGNYESEAFGTISFLDDGGLARSRSHRGDACPRRVGSLPGAVWPSSRRSGMAPSTSPRSMRNFAPLLQSSTSTTPQVPRRRSR